ncbi:MAG: hypothetical protein PHT60_00670 [Acidiphilium sp.]|nr:hypothetical protein [Acidiphilium sp.]MDD4934267.1 hypothetical protein [Acidiphilium sp.]
MIRPVTFITTMMALSSGAWMFVVKHQAEQLDRHIGGVTAQIRASEQRTRVLRAEWALETDPNRLARLAGMFLPELKPMEPDQLVTWSELADRLPPVGATVPHLPLPPPLPDQLPNTPVSPGPVASIAVPATTVSAVDLPPNAVPVANSMPATASTSSRPPHNATAHATTHLAAVRLVVKSHPAQVIRRVALQVTHHPLPRAARATWNHPIPLGQSVLAPARTVHPMGARVMTINAQAAPVRAPREASAAVPSQSVSVFGGYAADLAPPRPVGGSAP